MPYDYEVTLKGSTLVLPEEMLKATNLKDGDSIEISLLSPNRFVFARAAAHRDLFKPGTQVTRQGVESYLTRVSPLCSRALAGFFQRKCATTRL